MQVNTDFLCSLSWLISLVTKHINFFVYDSINCAHLILIGFYASCMLSFIMSVYNLYVAYFVDKTGKQNSLLECLLPLLSPGTLFMLSLIWAKYSKTNVIVRDPRIFLWTMGVVFSNIACHLIIAQMSSTRVKLHNKILFLYGSVVGLSLFGTFGKYELTILRLFAVVITIAHVHFGVCVVRQLCDHFKIQAFSLDYLKSKNKD